jgi:hypothetical protein
LFGQLSNIHLFDGIDAGIQLIIRFKHGAKAPFANLFQFDEIVVIAIVGEGLDPLDGIIMIIILNRWIQDTSNHLLTQQALITILDGHHIGIGNDLVLDEIFA